MEKFKSFASLLVGDILIRRSDNQQYRIEKIIGPDEDDRDANFVFQGFAVRGRGMKKFFKLNTVGEFIVIQGT